VTFERPTRAPPAKTVTRWAAVRVGCGTEGPPATPSAPPLVTLRDAPSGPGGVGAALSTPRDGRGHRPSGAALAAIRHCDGQSPDLSALPPNALSAGWSTCCLGSDGCRRWPRRRTRFSPPAAQRHRGRKPAPRGRLVTAFRRWTSPAPTAWKLSSAHDLRSPLTSILFLAETLQRAGAGPVKCQSASSAFLQRGVRT